MGLPTSEERLRRAVQEICSPRGMDRPSEEEEDSEYPATFAGTADAGDQHARLMVGRPGGAAAQGGRIASARAPFGASGPSASIRSLQPGVCRWGAVVSLCLLGLAASVLLTALSGAMHAAQPSGQALVDQQNGTVPALENSSSRPEEGGEESRLKGGGAEAPATPGGRSNASEGGAEEPGTVPVSEFNTSVTVNAESSNATEEKGKAVMGDSHDVAEEEKGKPVLGDSHNVPEEEKGKAVLGDSHDVPEEDKSVTTDSYNLPEADTMWDGPPIAMADSGAAGSGGNATGNASESSTAAAAAAAAAAPRPASTTTAAAEEESGATSMPSTVNANGTTTAMVEVAARSDTAEENETVAVGRTSEGFRAEPEIGRRLRGFPAAVTEDMLGRHIITRMA